ncbi:hypothetical protein JTY56_gp78 [Xanthomonas phage Bosa]|uniref:Uncharacterized protein n=2 Tax=Bosavirus TaxID=2946834 RepID=A0A679K698_9CAUD|nr:hypothetical protein JTY56_gp78 [Xanthomonas phage Bosa]YP_010739213.1 hypothetical protein P9A54_gp81 [Xanthomonas phage vB_Xar_IVIA-DoCa10]ATS92253.1 hypothetical protein [Stenotrophomonas phage DLP4]UYA99066.1 hypothetical protein IVIADoCa10_81 [Xanthomonas phage vB_Xar_IVIA-DoCa10]CAA2409936.1 hypothetical protein [Xanthomonas phage Bosa]
MDIQPAENFPDPVDRASAESLAHDDASVDAAKRAAAARQKRWAPREDGDCACGCGNEVDPRRLALGYGLTIECATKMERR